MSGGGRPAWAKRHGRPPWWPEGEPGPPWRHAPARFRRRFLLVSAAVLALLIGLGVVIGIAVSGGDHGRFGPPEGRGGPGGLFGLAAFVLVVGGGATVLAYRRISRPVGDLLGAAERVASGNYDVHVDPDGPQELRSLQTTFNQMARRLADADEQRRHFLADVTHELRTPLAVLQSGIEAQLDGIHPRDDRHLASLLEETQHLGRLVDDLHTLALADAGRLALHYERTHPAVLVEDAVEAHAALADRQGVRITSAVAPEVPEVELDGTRIRQVLGNLLANGIRHTPSGGEVRIDVTVSDGGIRFTVADSGRGFAPDQLPRLFERFHRSADSRGSGLGLSIARDLVQAHGGTIEAGNSLGAGALISFTVPTRPIR